MSTDTPVTAHPLRKRFETFWRRCLGEGAVSDIEPVWELIETRYTEPHRRYHDKGHLAHCLEGLDAASEHIEQPDRVEMALWFHDLINEPGQADNEARSAECLRSLVGDRLSEAFLNAVADLIMATTHRREPADSDQRYICDIDLASLGFEWEEFLRDSLDLKDEFRGPEQDYYAGKHRFLSALLERPRIFHTNFFFARYEARARENIRRFLPLLEARRI